MQESNIETNGIPQMGRLSALLIVLMCAGCSVVPGMRNEIDNGTISSPRVDVIKLTPEVLVEELLAQPPALIREDLNLLQSQKPSEERSYRLGVGDVVRVVVWEHPELNNPSGQVQGDTASSGRLIESDGTLFFPYVGKMKASGMTTAELRQEIAKSLTRIIREPQVDVRVTEFRSKRVYVTGEVAAPGPLFLNDNPIGALDAIATKGGFTDLSNRNRILLTRNGTTISLNSGDATHPDPRTSIHLVDGDHIHIPDVADDKIFLLGEFATQKTIIQRRGAISLAEALVEGGGLDRAGSNAKVVFIFRRKSEGEAAVRTNSLPIASDLNAEPTNMMASNLAEQEKQVLPKVYALDLTLAESLLLAERFPLNPRDVVYVASTDFSKYNRVVGQLLPTISAYFQLERILSN